MYELKTKENDEDVLEFIEAVEHPTRREDAYVLLDMFTDITGKRAKMWGPSIIGFGSYHYKYKTGHEGDTPVVGFSPRKARQSLYVLTGEDSDSELLAQLGKHQKGKSCLYVNKLADIDLVVLRQLIQEAVEFTKRNFDVRE